MSIPQLDQLTPRERQVLDELLQGKSNIEIGETLQISVLTVEVHIRHILQKTGARSRLALVVDIYESLVNGKLARRKA